MKKGELVLSQSAINRLLEVFKNKSAKDFFRVEVLPGGCQGFSTKFTVDNDFNADEDVKFTKDSITLVCDKTSLNIIAGSTIEFNRSLMGSYFWLNVKSAVGTCSCGTSFSI